MDFEWDEADARRDYGEERSVALGDLKGTVVILVFTTRKENIRIISVRKASKHERKIYQDKIASLPH
jgi:hypothetical protein